MIGIVIPAHNEAGHIGACVTAAKLASTHAGLAGEEVVVLVVLDRCTDATKRISEAHGAETISVDACNVGKSRAAGADHLLSRQARWLSFTDADTLVSPDWLVCQLSLGVEVVCGTVGVDDWSPHHQNAMFLRSHFAKTYTDADGHRHIHGANLGVCSMAYQRVGGFMSIACSEDVALVEALEANGALIAWSAAPRVTTSSRTDARARGGFGDTLLQVVASGVTSLSCSSGIPNGLA